MIEVVSGELLGNGVLGAVCLFFMIKEWKLDTRITDTLERISVVLDERLPHK